jgi:hypothetical protein
MHVAAPSMFYCLAQRLDELDVVAPGQMRNKLLLRECHGEARIYLKFRGERPVTSGNREVQSVNHVGRQPSTVWGDDANDP